MPFKALSAGAEPGLLRDPARLDIQTILCPVDFSEFSFRALTCAACIGRHFQSRLFVQHTIHLPPKAHLGEIEEVVTRELLQSELHRAGMQAAQASGLHSSELPEIHLLLNGGDIGGQILESIEKHNVDLLVMGTHGHKGFNRLMLGSVTERMVHEARCPVLVVSRPERGFVAPAEAEPVRLKTILLATDFSPNSDRALAYALKWAWEWSAKLILFHAVEEVPPNTHGRVDLFPEYNPYFDSQIAEAWETIQKQVPADADKRCEISYEVRHGNGKEEILQVAGEKRADVIVMGSKGLGMTAAAWGSTISGVVRDGRFPVLAVRHLHEP